MGKLANNIWFGDSTGGSTDHLTGDSVNLDKSQVAPCYTLNASNTIAHHDPSAKQSCQEFNEKNGLSKTTIEDFAVGVEEMQDERRQEKYRVVEQATGAYIRQFCEDKYSFNRNGKNTGWEEGNFQSQLEKHVNGLNQEQHSELMTTVIDWSIDKCIVGIFRNNMRQVTYGKMMIDKGILAIFPVVASKIYDVVKAIDSMRQQVETRVGVAKIVFELLGKLLTAIGSLILEYKGYIVPTMCKTAITVITHPLLISIYWVISGTFESSMKHAA